jgi:hypothetical protein
MESKRAPVADNLQTVEATFDREINTAIPFGRQHARITPYRAATDTKRITSTTSPISPLSQPKAIAAAVQLSCLIWAR